MKYIMIAVISMISMTITAQPNCNYFLSVGDTCQYEACRFLESQEVNYYQFDIRQINIWKEAIEICPRYAYPYREIAAPLVKSGNFLLWKKYIDLAVKHAPLDELGARAALRCKFFADYDGAIHDIDSLATLTKEVGYTHDGTYHLNVVKALCLHQLGRTTEAISWLEQHMNSPTYLSGLYENLHLGVMYMEIGNLDEAMECLNLQIEENDLAEVHYYLAQIYTRRGEIPSAQASMTKAKEYYLENRRMHDGYSELFDEISLGDIQ